MEVKRLPKEILMKLQRTFFRLIRLKRFVESLGLEFTIEKMNIADYTMRIPLD